MCGIGGLQTTKPRFGMNEALISVNLMESLTRRGTDAWGYYTPQIGIYKQPGDFKTAPERNDLAQKLVEYGTTQFLCHTRKSTKGNPQKNQNNHPFELGPFVFAHNGVIYEADEFKNPTDIETDSYWLLWWINEEYKNGGSVADAISAGVEHVKGIYACWLYNKEDKFTYLFRMNNPIVETQIYKEHDMFLFGSDVESIVDALGRYPKKEKVYRLKTNVIYRAKDAHIWEVGKFASPRLDWRHWNNFMNISGQGDLMKYHLTQTKAFSQ